MMVLYVSRNATAYNTKVRNQVLVGSSTVRNVRQNLVPTKIAVIKLNVECEKRYFEQNNLLDN